METTAWQTHRNNTLQLWKEDCEDLDFFISLSGATVAPWQDALFNKHAFSSFSQLSKDNSALCR